MPPSDLLPTKQPLSNSLNDGIAVPQDVKMDDENDASIANRAENDASTVPMHFNHDDNSDDINNLKHNDDGSSTNDDNSTARTPNLAWLDPFPTPCSSFGTHASQSRSDVNVNVFSPDFYRRDADDTDIDSGGGYCTPVRSRVNENHRAHENKDDDSSDHNHKSSSEWCDPFPTPEATKQPFSTPNPHQSVHDAYDDYQQWVKDHLPPLPCIDSPNNSGHHLRTRSTTAGLTPISKSASELNSSHPPPIRRISSENGVLFGRRIPSMEDILKLGGALGPDGNDLLLEEDGNNTKIITAATTKGRRDLVGKPIRRTSIKKRQSKDDLSVDFHFQPIHSRNEDASQSFMNRQHSKDDLDLLQSSSTNHTTPNTTNNNSNTFPKTRLTPLLTPVRKLIKANSQRLRQNLQQRREKRRLRREARQKQQQLPPTKRSWYILIPADHPYKIIWDIVTMLWALLGAYRTHIRIRDRVFDQSPLILLTEVWFTLDILLNFVTEHKTSKGTVIRDGKTVWARYLTSWFVVDLLSLIPWERIYVRPIVEQIKKRNFFQKTFFRSKAVIRVSRIIRGRHVKLIGRVSKQTGTPLRRIIVRLIKYVPKYLLFVRHMKGALFVRGLRLIHWCHNMYKKFWVSAKNAGSKARDSMRFRKRRRHLIFDLREENDDGEEEDSKGDDDEGDTDTNDDEDDSQDSSTEDDDDDSLYDLNEMSSMDVSEAANDYKYHRDRSQLSHIYQRSQSENVSGLRRRTFSEM